MTLLWLLPVRRWPLARCDDRGRSAGSLTGCFSWSTLDAELARVLQLVTGLRHFPFPAIASGGVEIANGSRRRRDLPPTEQGVGQTTPTSRSQEIAGN